MNTPSHPWVWDPVGHQVEGLRSMLHLRGSYLVTLGMGWIVDGLDPVPRASFLMKCTEENCFRFQ